MNLFNLENEVFAGLVKYGALTLAKTMAMTFVTGYFRFTRGSFASPEDARTVAPGDKDKQKELLRSNPDVERVRLCHRNDLENVFPFILLGLMYIATKPDPVVALWHFKIYFWSRLAHSITYVGAFPQPSRGIAFLSGIAVNFSMLFQVLRVVY